MRDDSLRFTLVLPAYNEEKAVGETLEKALASRQEILEKTHVKEMSVVLVDDGSTDKTSKIADEYIEVIKVRFDKNRGYGAAIKRGFLETDAQLVGFMDADGTCDPLSFVDLINHLVRSEADVVLGARLSPESQMPKIRKLGNKIFSRLIGWVSNQHLSDVASGIRVIRRASLKKMLPLPDGLHFTPAMSSIAVLDSRLKIEEKPVSYCERLGKSKLSVIKDGFRFLFSILFTSLCYNPLRVALFFSLLCFTAGASFGFFLIGAVLGSTMGVIVGGTFMLLSFLILSSGLLAHQINHLIIGQRKIPAKTALFLEKITDGKIMILSGLTLSFLVTITAIAALVFFPQQKYLWYIIAALFFVSGLILFDGILLRLIWNAQQKQKAEREDPFSRKQSPRVSEK